MPRQKRTQRSDLPERIKAAAWELIASEGASSLSLRAIARQLDITAPAIYNYFPRRDDLVTQLIIDAYTSFGDAQLAAIQSLPVEDFAGRLRSLGIAYRQWALAHPERYQLIFGTPIPGYVAPPEQCLPAAARSLSALVSVVEGLRLKGWLRAEAFPEVSPGYEQAFEVWKNYGGEADILSLSVAILIWSRVHGLVSLEIAGNLPPYGVHGDALYLYELDSIHHQFVKD